MKITVFIKQDSDAVFNYDYSLDSISEEAPSTYVEIAIGMGKSKEFIVKMMESLGKKYSVRFSCSLSENKVLR